MFVRHGELKNTRPSDDHRTQVLHVLAVLGVPQYSQVPSPLESDPPNL